MININQTSEQTKILIPRSNINGDIEKNNYVTEDELQEILKEYNTVPYLYILQSGEMVGDFDAVYDAVKNKKPYLLYVYSFNNTIFYNSLAESVEINGDKIKCSDVVIVTTDGEPKLSYKVLSIGKDGVTVEIYEEKILPTEFKTINGNEITGTGDIIIESGNGNIVELTQEEYNNITPEPDTLYVISDAPAVDTSEFATVTYVNEQIGNINNVLENIIG